MNMSWSCLSVSVICVVIIILNFKNDCMIFIDNFSYLLSILGSKLARYSLKCKSDSEIVSDLAYVGS